MPLPRRPFRATSIAAVMLATLVAAATTATPRAAHADASAPSKGRPRGRTCCAMATHLPLHVGTAHVPLAIGLVASPQSLGAHSYSGDGTLHETNGLVYTTRGGFIDVGHTRDYADLTAYLTTALRPLFERGDGVLVSVPMGGEVRIRVKARPSADALAWTTALVAQRVAFDLSVWNEILQYYGHSLSRGVDEIYSAFTPEDVYSNLLGTYVGTAALESPLAYDAAVDALLRDALAMLGAVSSAETRRTLSALAGRWWQSEVAWPSTSLAIKRSFDIGPLLGPVLAPPDVAPKGGPGDVVTLEVPEHDAAGRPLGDFYALEIVPDRETIPRWADAEAGTIVNGDDLPALVARVKASVAASAGARRLEGEGDAEDPHERAGALGHYLSGIRLVDLRAAGGIATAPAGTFGASGSGDGAQGVFGGSLVGVLGDTRGGDFQLVRFDASHTYERGLVAGFTMFRTDAVWFCHDAETNRLRAPLASLLGPCAPGEWLGIGGTFGEAIHDGKTGRTALRPLSLYGVLDVLGNGQSPSYDAVRVLVRAGGAIEHVWSLSERSTTIPRTGGSLVMMARTPGRAFEARGAVGYRVDPTAPRDAAFESHAALRWYFLLGGDGRARRSDGLSPWGVGSLGVEGGYAHWTRPTHAFPDVATPFVATDREGTWQLLLTTTLGFEGLTF